jgi:hypothetical protein
MADGDYEKFDVDNDYAGGQWIGGEFFYGMTTSLSLFQYLIYSFIHNFRK